MCSRRPIADKNRGFGFVEFADEADAADALANMDASELFGRTLRVTLARPIVKKNVAVWEEAETWFKSLEGDDTKDDGAGLGAVVTGGR